MSRHRLPPLNSLRAFESAGRLKSFSQAARELSVSHGAISRHVQQLEEWLGLALFVRRHRAVELTDEGAAYLPDATAALDRIAVATSRLVERPAPRVLRVNALITFALRWLVPRLSEFQMMHPNIEVRLKTSNEPVLSIGSSFDVIIRGGPEALAGYTAFEFLSESHLPVCSPKILAHFPLDKIRDLEQHTLLHAATLPSVWPDWLREAGAPDLQPRRSLTFEHFYVTLQAAADGLGVAIGPTALVEDDVLEGRLIKPFAGPSKQAWRYHAYVASDRSKDPANTLFLDWLRAEGKKSPSVAGPGEPLVPHRGPVLAPR
jgi:LysR family glycine cleavage system transcriptional activator